MMQVTPGSEHFVAVGQRPGFGLSNGAVYSACAVLSVAFWGMVASLIF
jgi:hypothetical protein